MADVHILAIDLAKRSFLVSATAPGGAVLLNRLVSRAKLEKILSEQPPCIVAMGKHAPRAISGVASLKGGTMMSV